MRKHFKIILLLAATLTLLVLNIIEATNTTSFKAENGFQVESSKGFYKVTVNGEELQFGMIRSPIIINPWKWL